MAFIKKWMWRLTSPKVPVVRLANQAKTIEFMGYLKKRENSLIDPWNQRGYEIKSGPVEIIINGKKEMGYAVDEAGITVEFKRDIRVRTALPVNPDPTVFTDPFHEIDDLLIPKEGYITYAWEGIIGKCSTLDDISEGLDLGKSMKNTLIGMAIGGAITWIIMAGMK